VIGGRRAALGRGVGAQEGGYANAEVGRAFCRHAIDHAACKMWWREFVVANAKVRRVTARTAAAEYLL
jgi:hypothetical protein